MTSIPIKNKLVPFLIGIALLCVCFQPKLTLAMPPVQRMVLPNQLVLLVCEEHSLPFVTFQLLINSGSRQDPSGQEGLANLTARGLLLGSLNRSVNTIK